MHKSKWNNNKNKTDKDMNEEEIRRTTFNETGDEEDNTKDINRRISINGDREVEKKNSEQSDKNNDTKNDKNDNVGKINNSKTKDVDNDIGDTCDGVRRSIGKIKSEINDSINDLDNGIKNIENELNELNDELNNDIYDDFDDNISDSISDNISDWSGGVSHISDPPIDDRPDDIIRINVAGERYQTYSGTLRRFPKTLLGDIYRRDRYLNSKGEYYFDRHSEAFEAILYFYQSKGVLYHPEDIPIELFLEELQFYEIDESIIQKFEVDNGMKEIEPKIELPSYKYFRIIWEFLEYPDTSRAAKIFALLSIFVIVISLTIFIIETLPTFSAQFVNTSIPIVNCNNATQRYRWEMVEVASAHGHWLFLISSAIIVWFSAELILRFITCPNKFNFFFNPTNIIDLLSILPYFMKFISTSGDSKILTVMRVIRVLRVLKLSRHSESLQILGKTLVAAREELAILCVFLTIKVLLFGSIIYFLESEDSVNKDVFTSIPVSAWWAIVSLTTIGYGDMAPNTLLGKLVGTMTISCSILILILPVPSVVSHFSHFTNLAKNKRNKQKNKDEKDEKEANNAVV